MIIKNCFSYIYIMKLTNIITQGILLGVSLITIFLAIINNPSYDGGIKWKEVLIWTALVQFFVGLYQLINAIIVTIRKLAKKQMNDYLKIYWLAVLSYFVIGGLLAFLFEEVAHGSIPNNKAERIYAYWFVSAWGIAIFYFVITVKEWLEYKQQKTNA